MSALGKYMAKFGNSAKDVLKGAGGELEAILHKGIEGAGHGIGKLEAMQAKYPGTAGGIAGLGAGYGLKGVIDAVSDDDESEEEKLLRKLGLSPGQSAVVALDDDE